MAATQARRYDPELQMFIDTPRDLDLDHLKFLKWLHDNGRLESRHTITILDENPEDVAFG